MGMQPIPIRQPVTSRLTGKGRPPKCLCPHCTEPCFVGTLGDHRGQEIACPNCFGKVTLPRKEVRP